MKFDLNEFRNWKNKSITLLGMSGVGKTYLSSMLRNYDWFHYSGDYRIGTRYLGEDILDDIKQEAMQIPYLRNLLQKDWIYIENNIKVDDLGPVLAFVGKLGNPEKDGIALEAFRHRQALYREAEIAAMRDVPNFIRKAKDIYGYQHFVNDVGGSLCDLEKPEVIDLLSKHTLILYIQATESAEQDELNRRAQQAPKPLYYRPTFLNDQLKIYLQEQNLEYAAQMDPDEFTRWIFPRLFRSRVPAYEAIAKPHGYVVTSKEAGEVRDESDFIELLETAVDRKK